MAIELQRAGEYFLDLSSRAIGISEFQATSQAEQVQKILTGQDGAGDKELSIIWGILDLVAGASMRAAGVNFRINKIVSSDKPSRFFKIFAAVGALAVDLAPYSLVFVNPLLLATKPLINAASHAVADIIEGRLTREDRLPKAPPGTYALLENASRKLYEKRLDGGVIRDQQGEALGTVVKERFCAIGGSCMEIRIAHEDNGVRWFDNAHITRNDHVVNIGSSRKPQSLPNSILKVEDLTNVLVT